MLDLARVLEGEGNFRGDVRAAPGVPAKGNGFGSGRGGRLLAARAYGYGLYLQPVQ